MEYFGGGSILDIVIFSHFLNLQDQEKRAIVRAIHSDNNEASNQRPPLPTLK